jgi:hypothetical protein
MQTASLIVITLFGGLLIPFAFAGYTSYTEKTVPDIKILFRLFLAGIVTFGAGAYAWLYGAGGDPGAVLESVGEALEVKEVFQSLGKGVSGSNNSSSSRAETKTGNASDGIQADEEIQVGVPPF